MDISELISGNYLKSSDIPEAGVVVTILTIKRAERDPQKLEIGFKGLDQILVANKTNIRRIRQQLGSVNTDDWIGKKIVIFNDPLVEFGDKPVGGIRVRPLTSEEATGNTPDGEANEQANNQRHRDDIPF